MPKNPTSYSLRAPLANVAKANALKVSVFFSAGGMNYANYKVEPKGYWVSAQPLTYTPAETPGGFSSESFMMFSGGGFKVFLQPATRFNSNALKTLARTVLAKTGDIAAAFDAGGADAAARILDGFKEAPVAQTEVA